MCPLHAFGVLIRSFCYSERSASTGSFFAAKRDGIRPATNVRNMLIATRIIAPSHGSAAIPEIPVYAWMITFTGMVRSSVIPIPIIPAAKPTINVSALNTLEISRLEAPMLRRIPIS